MPRTSKSTWKTTKKSSTTAKTAKKVSTTSQTSAIAEKVSKKVEEKNSLFQTLTVLLMIFLLVINLFTLFSLKSIVYSTLEQFEAMKVGWMENFQLLKKIMSSDKQRQQYKQQFEMMLKQLWENPNEDSQNNNEETNKPKNQQSNTLSPEELKKVVSWYYTWSDNAEIAIVEYSDLQCPFCRRHHVNWTLDKVMANYPWKVKVFFKHFPLSFHKNALSWALALECVWEQLWSKWYYQMIKEAYQKWYSAIDDLRTLAQKMWVNMTKFDQCVNSKKYLDKVKEEQNEWVKIFNVTWTPWNVVINLKNWKRVLISWAYPYSKFEEVINELQKD